MPSLVIWNSSTKKLLQSLPLPAGLSTFDAEKIIKKKELDSNDFTWAWFEVELTTAQFSKSMYITAGDVITQRPDIVATIDKVDVDADNTDYVTISGVSSGIDIQVNEDSIGTSDGADVEIIFPVAGVHVIKLVLFPYKTWRRIVYAS